MCLLAEGKMVTAPFADALKHGKPQHHPGGLAGINPPTQSIQAKPARGPLYQHWA